MNGRIGEYEEYDEHEDDEEFGEFDEFDGFDELDEFDPDDEDEWSEPGLGVSGEEAKRAVASLSVSSCRWGLALAAADGLVDQGIWTATAQTLFSAPMTGLEGAIRELSAMSMLHGPDRGQFSCRGAFRRVLVDRAIEERLIDTRRSVHMRGVSPQMRLWLAVGNGDASAVDRALDKVGRSRRPRHLSETLGLDGIVAAYDLLPRGPADRAIEDALAKAFFALKSPPESLVQFVPERGSKQARQWLGRWWTMAGETERSASLEPLPPYGREGLDVLAAFWSGDLDDAARIGNAAVDSMERKTRALFGIEGVCLCVANLAGVHGEPTKLERARAMLDSAGGRGSSPGADALVSIVKALSLEMPRRLSQIGYDTGWIDAWLTGLARVLELRERDPFREHAGAPEPWDEDTADTRETIMRIRAFRERAEAVGATPLADRFEEVEWALLHPEDATGLPAQMRAVQPWRQRLSRLEYLADSAPQGPSRSSKARLRWELAWDELGSPELTPRIARSERARMGTRTSVARLKAKRTELAPLSPEDDRILAGFSIDMWGSVTMEDLAIEALIGHPRVIDSSGGALEVVAGTLRIVSRSDGSDVVIELRPDPNAHGCAAFVEPVGPACVAVHSARSATQRELIETLRGGARLPSSESGRVRGMLLRLRRATGAELEGELAPEPLVRDADSRPVFALGWDGARLSIHATVAPLGLDGPRVQPGRGRDECITERLVRGEIELIRARRDRSEEVRQRHQALTRCPTLSSYPVSTSEWCVIDLEAALEIVSELRELGDAAHVTWPSGRELDVLARIDDDHLDLTVTKQRDWLAMVGRVRIDTERTMDYSSLIAAARGCAGRFVRVDGDKFVALSDALRRRLDTLASVGAVKGGEVHIPAALTGVVGELVGHLENVEFDSEARARIDRLRTLDDELPQPPSTFCGRLRPYQLEGYRWLWRRAAAGIGACLADDMGLGKTIQALALLAHRAELGPALVVAPTSVLINWCREAATFVPSLRVHELRTAMDREQVIASADRGDVVVCSYGVLTNCRGALEDRSWSTVVFDEAHALKNAITKRSRAAAALDSAFVVALTGTPIENRTEELWSLFRVLVPGLLGSAAQFRERFVAPIAEGRAEVSERLRTIARPFVLRRTKDEVLTELPPRTDVELVVEHSAEAMAYYEAVRARSAEEVNNIRKPAARRLRLLGELTRLRRAAIDPRLLDPEAPAGAKFDRLVELLAELRDGGHQAIVFTQFLESLRRAQVRLSAAGHEVLTLDGSTPTEERARRIDAFQRGDADVFVMSLRAGGVGINLTAADHVVHLDPWWNPAVEDQATDRAHRMGQARPITVVRLVAGGTIEERVLELHRDKRQLADQLLEGTGHTGGVDFDALLGLLA